MLSALFLLLAVLLAGSYGPLTAQTTVTSAASSKSSTDAGAAGQRTVPVVPKLQFLAADARIVKATFWDDGKSKAALAPKGFEFSAPMSGLSSNSQIVALVPPVGASGFDARAPPVRS